VIVVGVAIVVSVVIALVSVLITTTGIDIVRVDEHVDGRRANAVFYRLVDCVADGEVRLDRVEDGWVCPGVDERGTEHVTGRTGPTVESEDAHARSKTVTE
jgi:hypothetical protein